MYKEKVIKGKIVILQMRKNKYNSRRKYIQNYDNNILMRTLFVQKIIIKRFYGPFLWTRLAYLQVLCHYWAVDFFHNYLN